MTANTTPRIFDITITATPEQQLKAVHHCLCNGGFDTFSAYGLRVVIKPEDYQTAKRTLLSSGKFDVNDLCCEDVWIQVVKDGNRIVISDDHTGDYVGNLSLPTIHDNWDSIKQGVLFELYNEQDDADTADCILQTLCFGSIVYG